jgi:surface protein
MFASCSALTTIYVSDLWTTENVTSTAYVSSGSSSIVGQSGAQPYYYDNGNKKYGMTAASANYQTGGLTYYDGSTNTLCAGPIFMSLYPNTATEIYFGDYHTSIPEDESVLIDFSANGDGSVVGWLDDTILYITTRDGTTIKTTGSLHKMFYTTFSSATLTKVDLSGIDFSRCAGFGYMFYEKTGLTSVVWPEDIDVGCLVSTSYMFSTCSSLVTIDLSDWEPVSLQTTDYMFYRCNKLQTIYAGDWTQYNVTSSVSMFGRMVSNDPYPLRGAIRFAGTSADIQYANFSTGYFTCVVGEHNVLLSGSIFNTKIPSAATAIVFTNTVADGFTYTDVSEAQDGSILAWLNGTTYYVATVDGGSIVAHPSCGIMFYGKTSLKSVDFSNMDFSKVVTTINMFYGCTALTAVDLSMLDTSNVQSCRGMFQGCSKLTSVDLSANSLDGVSDMS